MKKLELKEQLQLNQPRYKVNSSNGMLKSKETLISLINYKLIKIMLKLKLNKLILLKHKLTWIWLERLEKQQELLQVAWVEQ